MNLVAVACRGRVRSTSRELEGLPTSIWLAIGVGWAVALVAWIVAALSGAVAHRQPPAARRARGLPSSSPRSMADDRPEQCRQERATSESHESQRPRTSSGSKSRKLGLAGKMYLPLFVQGLTTTARHLFSPKVTVSFPEERPKIDNPLIYRGVHRLEQGRAGPREVRGLLPVRHGLPGALHRHRGRGKPLARSRKVSRRASRSTSCAASSAACAKRPARSTRSS